MKKLDVLLGYAVGSGEPVTIPVRHMCIAGQTQEAGKTTALEGLISRSGLRAVTFITKRGEGSFRSARRIDPYFREQADWQFVASILEASRGEKLKFERAWIIRASRGAKTLADVQANVRREMKKAKGLSADVYLTLDAYLDQVVPTIEKVRWAKTVDIFASPGVNAMDLTGLPPEMVHLVIKSTIDWVLMREQNTIVVIPEAWKFIPQGRGTPVKLSAEAFIRQSAAMGNYLWLDSQDIGGIEKTILRSVPVWVLGVQREYNEIKRTILNIPTGISKPLPAALATLELGQFFACWGKHVVKTYAQPAWMSESSARQVADGSLSVDVASRLSLPQVITLPPPPDGLKFAITDVHGKTHHVTGNHQPGDYKTFAKDGDDDMTPAQEKKLDTLIDLLTKAVPRESTSFGPHPPPDNNFHTSSGLEARDAEPFRETIPVGVGVDNRWASNDALYEIFKARLIDEAPQIIMKLAQTRPELKVVIERETIEVNGKSLRGRIARLIANGFFSEAQTSATIGEEIAKQIGDRPSNIELGNELKALTEMGFFRRDNKWIRVVPEMVVNVVQR